jgi:hypothetical protein
MASHVASPHMMETSRHSDTNYPNVLYRFLSETIIL